MSPSNELALGALPGGYSSSHRRVRIGIVGAEVA